MGAGRLRRPPYDDADLDGFCFKGEEVTKISNAILLGYILRWLRDPTASYSMGYLYAGMMMLCTLVDAVLRHFMFYISIRTGFQMRVGLIASVYRKLLQLSLSHTASTGVIVNLVSNDVQKLEDFSPFAYFLLLGPIESIIVGVILIVNIGVGPALAGLATLYLIIPIQAFFANRFSLYRKETVRIRDDRIRSTSDVLFGMNVVKLYAWYVGRMCSCGSMWRLLTPKLPNTGKSRSKSV